MAKSIEEVRHMIREQKRQGPEIMKQMLGGTETVEIKPEENCHLPVGLTGPVGSTGVEGVDGIGLDRPDVWVMVVRLEEELDRSKAEVRELRSAISAMKDQEMTRLEHASGKPNLTSFAREILAMGREISEACDSKYNLFHCVEMAVEIAVLWKGLS